ncbi:MAG: hypothetical protein ABL974_19470 [Prosthecobacter sp.]
MEQQGVKYHETNSGRETQQGIAGFEGLNALWFMLALGLSLMFFRKMMDGDQPNMMMAALVAAIPLLVVSLYVFGLKQGKPASYDIELGEWLIIKATSTPYFSPKQVETLHLPWMEDDQKKKDQA